MKEISGSNAFLDKILLQEITLTDEIKKDIDISPLTSCIHEKYDNYLDINYIMEIYKNLANRIKYNQEIQEMLEDGYDVNFKNVYTIDEAIRRFFIKVEKNGMQDAYSDMLKELKLLGEILQRKELEPNELLDDLIVLADLNRVKVECFETILKRMLIKYHKDLEKSLGVELSLNELEVTFFEACFKTVKNICYDYIKQNNIPAGLRSQYMEVYTKYIIDTYKLNIPTTSYSYSYIKQNSEKYNEIVLEFSDYIKVVPVEKIIADEACRLYKDKVNDMDMIQIENLFENAGYIKKKLLAGRIYLRPQSVCYDIKKAINYCNTEEELKELKTSINQLLEEEILTERHIFAALKECDDEYKVAGILEEVVKRNIDYGLQKDIMFFAASRLGNANIVKKLLDTGIRSDLLDEHGKTPLMYACESGNLETVKLLLDASEYTVDDLNGTTNLMYACKSGAKNVAKYLIEQGVDVNKTNKYKKTALMYAYQNNDLELIEMLLQNGADPTIKDKYKKTIIQDALQNKRVGILKLVSHYVPNIKIELSQLLRDSKDPESVVALFENYINELEQNGMTPLVNLCDSEDYGLAKILIDNGANVNKLDKKLKTPLQHAFERNNADEILFLVENGADREMAARYACEHYKTELLRKLLELGVDIDMQYSNGETLLMLACVNARNAMWIGKSDEEKKMQAWRGRRGRMKEFLLEHSMNINQKNDLKINALTYAWVNGDTKTAAILIQKGIDIEEEDVAGIMRKYGDKDKELVKALLERGIKIKQTIVDKELKNEIRDIKEIKKACKRDKIDKVTKLLANDNVGYKRIAINKLLAKHMFDSLAKKTKRTNLAKKIATELVQIDNDFIPWVVNSKNVRVLNLLLNENLLKKKGLEKVLKLVEYSNNDIMQKMVKEMSTTGVSKVKVKEK